MSLKDFKFLNKLGQGAYSSVFKVKRVIDDQIYAIKKVKLNNLTEHQKQNALNEVRILASIHHPNVISYKQSFLQANTNFLYIVMEYADKGDLYEKINDHIHNNSRFLEDNIWSTIIQVTRGLKQLHDMKIMHRDLKSANVFLFSNGDVKIGDMNVSKEINSQSKNQTGTPYYASPQVWKGLPYDIKSDLWSLGCIIYELICLKHPFRANDISSLSKKVTRGYYPKIPSDYSQQLNIILKMLLQVTPHLRASCDKILDLPIVKKHLLTIPNQANFLQNQKSEKFLIQTIKYEHQGREKMSLMMPKPRYRSTVQYIQRGNKIQYEQELQNIKDLHQKSLLICINRRQKLPKIQQGRKQKVFSEIGLRNEKQQSKSIVSRLIEPLKRQDQYRMKGIKNKIRLESEISSEKRLPFLFEGRMLSIIPENMRNSMNTQKERSRILSLQQNKDQ